MTLQHCLLTSPSSFARSPMGRCAAAVAALLAMSGCGGGESRALDSPLWIPTDVKLADLDGDGRLDIVASAYASRGYGTPGVGRVAVWRQTAPGAFSGPDMYDAGFAPWKLAVDDIDGDGAPDLVLADVGGHGGTNGISMLRQDPLRRGTFAPAQRLLELPEEPYDLAVGDVNGDGVPDILVTGSLAGSSGPTLLTQDRAHRGRFLPAVTLDLPGSHASGLAVGDLDGDGRNDVVARVVVASQLLSNATALGVRYGQPDGTLGPWVELPSPASNVNSKLLVVTDANGDGKSDVLERLSPCCEGGQPQVRSLLHGADGSWALVNSSLAGLQGSDGQVFADLDGDGRMDFALVGSYPLPPEPLSYPEIKHQLNVLRQAGAGAFIRTQTLGLPLGDQVGAGDLDGDGLNDLVIFDVEDGRPVLQLVMQSPSARGLFVAGPTVR